MAQAQKTVITMATLSIEEAAQIFRAGTVELRSGEHVSASAVRDVIQSLRILKSHGKSRFFHFFAGLQADTVIPDIADEHAKKCMESLIGSAADTLNPITQRILNDVLQPQNGFYVLDHDHITEQWKANAAALGYFGLFHNELTLQEFGLVTKPKEQPELRQDNNAVHPKLREAYIDRGVHPSRVHAFLEHLSDPRRPKPEIEDYSGPLVEGQASKLRM